MKYLIFPGLAFLISLSACDTKNNVRNVHESQQSSMQKSEVDKSEDRLQLSQLDLKQTERLVTSRSSSLSTIYQQVVVPLEQKILNINNLTDAHFLSQDFSHWLAVYTQALHRIQKEGLNKSSKASVDKFVEYVEYGCLEGLRDCSLLQIFKMSPYSSAILVEHAKAIGQEIDACPKNCEALVINKYKYLSLASKLNASRVENLDFILTYIAHANQLEKLKNSPEIQVLQKLQGDYFQTLITFLDGKKMTLEQSCGIAKKFNSWTFSKKESAGLRISSERLFELASRCDLYDAKADRQLSQSLKEAIQQIQKGPQTQEVSFWNKVKLIQDKPEGQKMFSDFGLSGEVTQILSGEMSFDFFDEYFYVIDRLYNGHLIESEARQILLVARRDYSAMLKKWDIYNKFQIVFMIDETKKYLSKNLHAKDKTSDKLFARAIEESEALSRLWMRTQANSTTLKGLILNVIQSSASSAQFKEYKALEKKVESLAQTVKFVATYPAMMMLSQKLAESDAPVTVQTWWGAKFDKQPNEVISQLWEGLDDEPWFMFSEGDRSALDKFMILYAFEYALRGAYFNINGTSGLENFVKTFIGKYLGEMQQVLRNGYNNDLTSRVEGLSQYSNFTRSCDYELNTKSQEVSSLLISLQDLEKRIHVGQSGDSLVAAPATNFLSGGYRLLMAIRQGALPRLKTAELVLEVLKKHNAKANIKETEKIINDTKELIQKITTYVAEKNERFTSCLKRFALVESYLQFAVYESERAYLTQVWKDMESLQKIEGSAQILEKIKALNDLPERYKNSNLTQFSAFEVNYDRIQSKTAFVYSKYDFIIRLKKLLENDGLSQMDSQVLAQHQKQLAADFPDLLAKPLAIPRKWEVQMPENLIDKSIVADRSKDAILNWSSDPQVFVEQGLKKLNGNMDSFVNWYTNNNSVKNLEIMARMDVELYVSEYSGSIDKENQVTAQKVIRSGKDYLRFVHMRDLDIKIAKEFGFLNKAPIQELKKVILNSETEEPLYPLQFIYDEVKDDTQFSSDIFSRRGRGFLKDSFILAQNVNDPTFRLYFDLHGSVTPNIIQSYKTSSQFTLSKLRDLHNTLKAEEELGSFADIVYKIQDGTARTLRSEAAVDLKNYLIHPERYRDISLFIRQFTDYTQNIFETKNLVIENSK